MDRRMRRAAIIAACVSTMTFTAAAYAYVLTDMNDWNLSESTSTYGNGTQFHIASGTDGNVSFRWLDSPNKVTVVSANYCSDWSQINASTYGVGDTSYHVLFNAGDGFCFVMRGRTASGQGTMVNHDGRVQRCPGCESRSRWPRAPSRASGSRPPPRPRARPA